MGLGWQSTSGLPCPDVEILIETGRGPAISLDLPGPLLAVPRGLRVTATGPTEMRLALDSGQFGAGSTPDALVGSVPLVSWDANRHAYEVAQAVIPPPPPFLPDDVSTMWQDVISHGLVQPRPVFGQGHDAAAAAVISDGLRLEAVAGAIAAAQRLLGEWPSSEQRELVWRSPEIPGARIDLRATERSAGRYAGYVGLDGRRVPSRVAGRRVGSTPWSSRTLAAAALALREALEAMPTLDESVSRPATAILERVAVAASGAARGSDPPVSAWPRLAAQALRLILSALVQLRARGTGVDAVPLTDLWRLYEAWVALQVSRELATRFGGGAVLGSGQVWSSDDYAVTMTVQTAVGGSATAMPHARWGRAIRSVSSDLIPDVLVGVQGRRGQRLIVIETKQRTTDTALDAGAIAEAASKYVWGIRDAADDDALPVSHVVVVSSARIDKAMHSAPAARISSSWLLPGRGDGALPVRLNAALSDAIAAVR